MSSCDNTVLTGQEGLIQFKPLGTTNCVDDYCPFMGDRIYLPCSADYDIGDCIEVERVKIPVGEGVSYDGGVNVIADGDSFYIVDDGKGVAGDVDACGNDMEGVPYIKVSLVEDGTAIIWDTSMAGDPMTEGVLSGDLTITEAGTGYNGGQPLERLTGVDLINQAPTLVALVITPAPRLRLVLAVQSPSVTITSGGANYSGRRCCVLGNRQRWRHCRNPDGAPCGRHRRPRQQP